MHTCMLPLIHKALSLREPGKQHYYYHRSPRTEETEAAEGEVGCPDAPRRGRGGGSEGLGRLGLVLLDEGLRGEEGEG